MNIEADLKHFIASELLPAERSTQLADDSPLVSSGWVDSMGLLQILGRIQQRFGVDLMSVRNPRDFDSITALAAAVRRNKPE
jgi:acyl carrier protein